MAWNRILSITPQMYEAQLNAEARKKRMEEEQKREDELIEKYMAPLKGILDSCDGLLDAMSDNVKTHAEVSQQLAQMIKDKAPKEDIREMKEILKSLENQHEYIMYGE